VSGTYTVTVKATDRRGLAGTTSTRLTYDCNRPPLPTISATASGTCTSASSVTFSVADLDGATDGPWSYEVTWGDGSAPTTGTAATAGASGTETHAYAVSGTYAVTVKATDRRGLSAAASSTIAYYCNRPPAVTVTDRVGASCTAGASTTFSIVDADGASDAPWSWVIAWGDGTTSSGSASASSASVTAPHAYLANGSFAVTITVTDRRGLAGTTTTTLARACAAASCVEGHGYWKSHEEAYPYPYAATAPWLVDRLASPTWSALLSDGKSGGSSYLQLASQWAAATLNYARGAPAPAAVLQTLGQAEAWLRARQGADGSVPAVKDAQAESWASTLDAYNAGKLGPPRCN
jgi:hypothetical protein